MSYRQCGMCGKIPAAGHASCTTFSPSGESIETWYCHGDTDVDLPTCYQKHQWGKSYGEMTLGISDWPLGG